MPEIRIIHTSDFHGQLTPAKAERLLCLKEEHGAVLVDTGDAIRAPNVLVFPWRERTISLMNDAGYDATGLGNREHFHRESGMQRKTGHAEFVRLCANCIGRDGEIEGVGRTLVLEAGGGRLGLLGLMPTMIPPGRFDERLSDLRFVPWQDAAREAVGELAGSCDMVAALFHRSDHEIDELLIACPEVKLVLAGHDHIVDRAVEVRGDGRVISRVGKHAEFCRALGLRIPDGTVTMDELVSLE